MERSLDHDDYPAAAARARSCGAFIPDDEDEWAADEPCSCFNCRSRRWTPTAATCMKPGMAP